MRHSPLPGAPASTVLRAAAVLALALTGCGRATADDVGAAPVPVVSLAKTYPNYPQDPAFFPIAIWYQIATRPGSDDHAEYVNEAAAAAAVGVNILQGTAAAGPSWPEHFGSDNGELAAIRAAHIYFFAGDPGVDMTSATSARSVKSILALAAREHALGTIIGYMGPDEPHCATREGGAPFTADVPPGVGLINQQDPTRPVMVNMSNWVLNAGNIGGVDNAATPLGCLASKTNALRASAIASVDWYPLVNAYAGPPQGAHAAASDFLKVSNDNLWEQALTVAHVEHFARPGQPIWAFVDAGGDALTSPTNNAVTASTTAGSTVLAVHAPAKVTAAWDGLKVSGPGIAPGTTLRYLDAGSATLSAPATATGAKQSVTLTGGVIYHGHGSSCVRGINLCLATGQEYRATPAEVNAEVWNSLIAGATGIEWFCQDGISQAFCLGGNDGTKQGRDDARAVADNLRYIDGVLASHGAMLNSPVSGRCMMDTEDYVTDAVKTVATCSGGNLTLTTSKPSVPGLALAHVFGDATFLLAQSDRRSPAGAAFTFKLAGLAGKTATVVYDSNARYDPPHAALNATFKLGADARFSDTLGANGDDYQVKIYAIR